MMLFLNFHFYCFELIFTLVITCNVHCQQDVSQISAFWFLFKLNTFYSIKLSVNTIKLQKMTKEQKYVSDEEVIQYIKEQEVVTWDLLEKKVWNYSGRFMAKIKKTQENHEFE